MTAPSLYDEPPGSMIAVWALLLLVPLLLAAELAQRSNSLSHLPDRDAYRSRLSERTLNSSTWRHPSPPSNVWRAPASPQIEWRTDSDPKPSQSMELRDVELYPNLGTGESSTFDLSTREDQSGIKIFEFDFGR